MLTVIEAQDRSIKHLEAEIERHLQPYVEKMERCEKITGVSRHVLHVLMAEVGTEMGRFPDSEHVSSWAGVCPGYKESAGKRLSGRSRPGNRSIRAALVQAAHGVRRSHSYLGERYRRLKKRRGSKRAALVVGHSIVVIYYQMMRNGTGVSGERRSLFRAKRSWQGRASARAASGAHGLSDHLIAAANRMNEEDI